MKDAYSDTTKKSGSLFTITARITIWYAVFLLLISATLMIVLYNLYNDRIDMSAETKLIKVVDEVGDMIISDGDDFIFDDRIQYYYKEVYISVYEHDGELLVGRRPRRIDDFPPIDAQDSQTVTDTSGNDWYIYDTTVRVEGKNLYIRGMLSGNEELGNGPFEISIFAVLLPIIVLLAALGGYLITRQAFSPVRKIIETTEEITKDGDLSRRIPLGRSRDEIYQLSRSFNDMFDQVEDMVKREKQFTSDVSHELRTPIAIIRSQSEFAMEDKEYAEEAAEIINRESQRMSRLISNLLMIARSDAGRIVPEITHVNASELIRELIEIRQIGAEREGCKIVMEIEDGIEMETDEIMLARMAANLIDNAIKYGKPADGAQPVVKVSVKKDGDDMICRVSDNGEGIHGEDREKIWERFYQTDTARTNSNSSGLGLSIVTAFAKALNAEARLLPEEESEMGGASFEIRVPMAYREGKDGK